MSSEEAANRVAKILGDSVTILLGPSGEKNQVLDSLDKAQEIAQGIPGDLGTLLSQHVKAYRFYALGVISMAKVGKLEETLENFMEAQKLTRDMKEKYPDATDDVDFRQFELGIEAQIVSAKIQGATGQEKSELKARQADLFNQIRLLQEPEDPMAYYFSGLFAFQKALPLSVLSGEALGKLDLEDATNKIEEATELMRQSEESFKKYKESFGAKESPPFALQGSIDLVLGLGHLIKAQESVRRSLHDAIVGELRDRNVARLEEADRWLREGRNLIEKGAAVATKQFGQLVGEFPLDTMGKYIDFQAERINNLRQLIKRGLGPKEVTRRSSMRFLLYFIVTFGFVLLGSRLSGLVIDIGARELVNILLIALVVSITASFGYEVGLKYLGTLMGRFRQ